MFKLAARGKYEYADVFPFIYLKQELEFIRSTIEAFHESRHNSLAIICKTQERANLVHSRIGIAMSARLIDADSKVFSSGVLIATAYLAKGLEFDQVVVPFCTAKEYQSPIDRHMLYVACTRAMHHLVISHTAQLSPFLQAALDAGAAIAGRPASESVA